MKHRLFCNSLLAGLPSSSLNRLQAVQNAAARLLMKKKKFDHITPILTELHTLLPVRKRIQFKVLLLTFKALHDRSPGYISSLIEERKLRPGLRTSGLSLRVPITRLKTYGDRAFSGRCSKTLNSLPVILRQLDDLETFKADLKTHLFRQM